MSNLTPVLDVTLENPKDIVGQRKVQMALVPPSSIIAQALAMEDGAIKYGPYNWREYPVRCMVYLNAAQRHLAAFLDGEQDATDSGKPHLGHALACIGIVVDCQAQGNLIDDRPRPGAASAMIAKYTKEE